MQRPEFSIVDRLTVLLLEAEEEEPAVLKITSDNRPGPSAFAPASYRDPLLKYLSTQIGIDQSLRHFLNGSAQHLIVDVRLAAPALKGPGLKHTPHGQFEITEQTREAAATWIARSSLRPEDFLFPSRVRASPHLSTRQYARIVRSWVSRIGLDPAAYGTHTLRRTKASLIYRRTKNLRAVQLLLAHTKLESTVRYLGIEVDEALEMAEQTEV